MFKVHRLLVGQVPAVSNSFCPRNAGLSGSGFWGNNVKPIFINNRIDKFDNRFQNSIIIEYETSTRQFNINFGVLDMFQQILKLEIL